MKNATQQREIIYLDYNSTHPPLTQIIEGCNREYFTFFANTSGISSFSQKSNWLLEESRKNISEILNVDKEQAIFTSSATEANFLALVSISRYIKKRICQILPSSTAGQKTIRVGTTALEHPSITEALKKIEFIETVELLLDRKGLIDTRSLETQLKNQEIDLLVCMLVHNETGIIQPISAILDIIEKYPIPMVCDAVQALSRLEQGKDSENISLNLFSASKKLPVFFTFAGHKIGAGFGTGLLILSALPEYKILHQYIEYAGGAQEFQMRPGSHNLATIRAFSRVLSKQIKKKYQTLKKLTGKFETRLKSTLGQLTAVRIVGEGSIRLAGTTMTIFPKIPIDFMLMGLDQENIIVSTGTSCRSKSRKVSEGLLALGLSPEEALSVVRFSYDENFSLERQRYVLEVLQRLVQKLAL